MPWPKHCHQPLENILDAQMAHSHACDCINASYDVTSPRHGPLAACIKVIGQPACSQMSFMAQLSPKHPILDDPIYHGRPL